MGHGDVVMLKRSVVVKKGVVVVLLAVPFGLVIHRCIPFASLTPHYGIHEEEKQEKEEDD